MSKGSFRPRRGKRATAISKGIVLKSGEIFFEVPDSGIGTAPGNIVMGDGTTAYEELPYYTESGSGFGTVTSVNHVGPDSAGDVTLTSVPYAENILSSDNLEQTDTYVFRTAGGSADISSGDADLDKIKGNCVVDETTGEISIATPTSFKAIGLNQFNKNTMILAGYTISAAGKVTAQSGSYVCYAHAVGGLDTGYIAFDSNASITRIGWCDAIPTTSTSGITVTVDNVFVTAITNNATKSYITNTQEGYICVACTNNTKLCIHPKWSGSADNDYADYSESIIQIPTKDADNNNLPLATYGFPSVDDVRDELNLAQKSYTQRIGHYPYSAENLVAVEAYGTPFIYDNTHIFYVLKNPIIYTLAATVTSAYTVHDFGTEEFLGTTVGVNATTVYGENLKDKLRRDVVTISKQSLSANQRSQVRSNIDAAQNYLEFTEAEDAPNQTLLNTIVSGNPMNTLFGAEKRLLRRLDAQVSGKVSSVNHTLPDSSGNVDITRVPLADNIYSPDNNENYEGYIYRTSGGTSDLNSGESQLSFIRGNTQVIGRVEESLEAGIYSSHTPEEGEEYDQPNVVIDAATWRNSSLGSASGTYTFTYDGTNWKYNSGIVSLDTYGMTVTGDLYPTDYISVVYVKAERGTLVTIKPTSFVSIGLNQFNKSNMILSNYTINSSGAIVAQSGSYVAYAKAPYSNSQGYIAYDSNSTITRIGYIDTVPAAGKTVSLTGAAVTAQIATTTGVPENSVDYGVGYVAVACTNINGICIHPRWSGGEDTNYKAYTASTITIPTKDASNNNLPFVSYGLPSVGSVADEINFDLKEYIQRVGHYAYSAANLAIVQALGVDYDYDASHIFYVLTNPVRIALAASVSGIYTVHDYGTEHFEYSAGTGTTAQAATAGVMIFGDHLYGQNLRDKLRRDVLTISAQTLSDSEKTQVLTNIGAASAASVTQLNNESVKKKVSQFNYKPSEGKSGWIRVFYWHPSAYLMKFKFRLVRTYISGTPLIYTVDINLNAAVRDHTYTLIGKNIDNCSLTTSQAFKIRISDYENKRGIDVFLGRPDGQEGSDESNTYYAIISDVALHTNSESEYVFQSLTPCSVVVNDIPSNDVKSEFNILTNTSVNQLLGNDNGYTGNQFIVVRPDIEYTLYHNKFFCISVPRITGTHQHITFYDFRQYINMNAIVSKFSEIDYLSIYSVKDGLATDYLSSYFDIIKGGNFENVSDVQPLVSPQGLEVITNGLDNFQIFEKSSSSGFYIMGYITATQDIACKFKLEFNS